MIAKTPSTGSGATQHAVTPLNLLDENHCFAGTAGVSRGNRHLGFVPAFLEARSGEVFLSRFADGRPAPIHVLDGLPPALVTQRTSAGRVSAVLGSVISGFVQAGRFYTREQTAKLLSVSA